jgi:hypothetical protein
MDLRLKGLNGIDPLTLPLPHGTEVSTRVDRVLGERRVPQGAVGRVVGLQGEYFEVQVVGVGIVQYLRHELLPRKAGQMRFAYRREAAWAALRSCVLIEATVGSHAWGLADGGSDTDLRGIFALPFPWTQGLVEPPRDLVSADGSSTYWECGKAFRQALRADPNTLELLFVPNVRVLDPVGEWLLHERDAFVSSEIYGSFGRYALSQLKKLQHSLRLAEHRSVVLSWLREQPVPTLDEVGARLAKLSTRSAPTTADAELQAKEYVKQLYRSLHDQGLLPARDFQSLVAFAQRCDSEFDLPRELRPKNAYNLLRLIGTAVHWLRTGTPEFEAEGAFRDRLMAIKKGDVPLEDVLRMAEAMMPELETARQQRKLPGRPDVGRADTLLRRIGEEMARRFIQEEAGPFGRDAAAPPEITWEPEP